MFAVLLIKSSALPFEPDEMSCTEKADNQAKKPLFV